MEFLLGDNQISMKGSDPCKLSALKQYISLQCRCHSSYQGEDKNLVWKLNLYLQFGHQLHVYHFRFKYLHSANILVTPVNLTVDDMADVSVQVVVIGCGISGIAATKCMIDGGYDVIALEKSSFLGGLWHYSDTNYGVMKFTHM